jgi:hypothetical protein
MRLRAVPPFRKSFPKLVIGKEYSDNESSIGGQFHDEEFDYDS